jgi:hypothetical protein
MYKASTDLKSMQDRKTCYHLPKEKKTQYLRERREMKLGFYSRLGV